MKKMIAVLSAAVLCCGALTACSGVQTQEQKETPPVAEAAAPESFPDYVSVNPDTGALYNNEAVAWDSEQHVYRLAGTSDTENISPEILAAVAETAAPENEPSASAVEIPAGMQQALDAFDAEMQTYYEENPRFAFRSDYYFLDDTQALRNLKQQIAVPYFDTVFALAADESSEYHVLCSALVNSVLKAPLPLGNGDMAYYENGRQTYLKAQDAADAYGADITAQEAAALQAEYGYLIVPALRKAGKLELLQTDADGLCTDAEQLAGFAEAFA